MRANFTQAHTEDPELAQIMVTLYDKAVAKLGEPATLSALKTAAAGFAADDQAAKFNSGDK